MKVALQQRAMPASWTGEVVPWKRSLPFCVNSRGVLSHRVRDGHTFLASDGSVRHHSVHYWCGNIGPGDALSLFHDPPADRLLCAFCEAQAVAHGQPTAEQLTGRHVCIGKVKAQRLCCHNETN